MRKRGAEIQHCVRQRCIFVSVCGWNVNELRCFTNRLQMCPFITVPTCSIFSGNAVCCRPQRCGRQTAVRLINHSSYTMRSVIPDDINMTGAHVEVTTPSCNPLRDLSVAPSRSWVYIWPLHTNTSGLLNLHIAYLCYMQLHRCVEVIDSVHCEQSVRGFYEPFQ